MSKSRDLLEQLEEKGWYIVRINSNDQPGAGPYDSNKAARLAARSLQWYDREDWDIRYGYVDEDDQFVELPKP